MAELYAPNFIERYLNLTDYSEEYYVHCVGFLLGFLKTPNLIEIESIKPHFKLIEMLYSVRTEGGRELTKKELCEHLGNLRQTRKERYGLPDLSATNPDWQKVLKLFSFSEYPEPIPIPKKNCYCT